MEDEQATPAFRYRVMPASTGRLFGLAFWFLVAVTVAEFLLVGAYLALVTLIALLTGEPGATWLAAIWPVLALVGVVVAPMIAFAVLMRWGRFVGAQLAFVRRHPLDTARAKGLVQTR